MLIRKERTDVDESLMESVSCVTPGEAQEERLDERQKIFRYLRYFAMFSHVCVHRLLRCFAKEERDTRPAGSSFKEHRYILDFDNRLLLIISQCNALCIQCKESSF